jgi:serine phosphatase RsbU (regulator of sigma subunit)
MMDKTILLIGLGDALAKHVTSILPESLTCTNAGTDVNLALEKMGTQITDLFVIHETSLGRDVTADLLTSIHEVYRTPILLISQNMKAEEKEGVFILHENSLSAEAIGDSVNMVLSFSSRQKSISEELNMYKVQVEELTETNAHLITATFRERSLKKELEASKALIEEQSKKILDSINYSLRIQQSIIPAADIFTEALGDHFVYYRPKDVVSGDFPWMFKKDNCTYFAAVDCTGHGVPGAMMSMIGNLLLNSIVQNGQGCKTPSEILLELHRSVVRTLKQDAEGNKAADGMDAALCRIDFNSGELIFSGAHLPLFLLKNGELEVFKGDKFPVGGMQYRNRNTYVDHSIQLHKGDRVFVFSDGIIDQVGGPENMKWMSSSLKEFILANATLNMEELKAEVHRVFEEYKGANKQVDDVLLIGLQYE